MRTGNTPSKNDTWPGVTGPKTSIPQGNPHRRAAAGSRELDGAGRDQRRRGAPAGIRDQVVAVVGKGI
uniref:Uncharacterized protein n=1 Tax=Arundo donax TaxID=35708 RepID=A0A0A9EZ85_ARUDO